MDKEFIFKSIKMGKELQIAGEFIYESARRMLSLSSFQNSFEINSILYNGAVGIERVQKVLICMLKLPSPNDCDDKKLSEILHGHNHQVLHSVIHAECTIKFDKYKNKILELFQDYYKNYRYADYLYDENLDINKLFSRFLNNYDVFDVNTFYNDEYKNSFKKKYIDDLGSIAKKYFELIRKQAYKQNVYTYEFDSSSVAASVFKGSESLYERLVFEQNSISELLITIKKSPLGLYGKYFDSFNPIDIDVAMVPEYVYDLLNFRVNDTLVSIVESEYEEMPIEERKQRLEDLKLMSSCSCGWDYDEEDLIG